MDRRFDNDAQTTGTLPDAAGARDVASRRRREPAGLGRGGAAGLDGPGQVPRVRAGRAPRRGRRVSREWTRIGRSLAADIRFDDATVSRRHALVVSEADGVRVLDDRSLNGI